MTAALIARLNEALLSDDPQAYVDLFDYPTVLFTEDGIELRADADACRRRYADLRALLRDYGAVRYNADTLSIRPYGQRLLVVRQNVCLELADGSRTDDCEEVWCLRDDEGRMRIVLATNILTRVCRVRPPRLAAGATDIAALMKGVELAFNDKDVARSVALFDVPFARIFDDSTDVVTTESDVTDLCRRFFERLGDTGIESVTTTLLNERPIGEAMVAARIEVRTHFRDGRDGDPYEELWITRDRGPGLRLSAIVNPFSTRAFEAEESKRSPA